MFGKAGVAAWAHPAPASNARQSTVLVPPKPAAELDAAQRLTKGRHNLTTKPRRSCRISIPPTWFTEAAGQRQYDRSASGTGPYLDQPSRRAWPANSW